MEKKYIELYEDSNPDCIREIFLETEAEIEAFNNLLESRSEAIFYLDENGFLRIKINK